MAFTKRSKPWSSFWTWNSDTLQWYFTVILYSDTLQWYFTMILYSDTLQWYFTVIIYSDTLQRHFTVILYSDNFTCETPVGIVWTLVWYIGQGSTNHGDVPAARGEVRLTVRCRRAPGSGAGPPRGWCTPASQSSSAPETQVQPHEEAVLLVVWYQVGTGE